MFYNQLGISVALFSACVAGIAFPGPVATPVVKRLDANGWTPKPTSEPRPLLELFRRQEDPSFCGYLEGDPEYAVTCQSGRSCMYDDRLSWFGCCTGTSITDCNVITACVESRSISACSRQSDCINDSLLTACTDKSAPYCVGLYTVLSSETYGHYECGPSDSTYEIMSTATTSAAFSSVSLELSATDSTEFIFTDETSRTEASVSLRPTSTNDDDFTSTEESTSSTSVRQITSSSGDTITTDTPSTTAEGAPGGSQPPSQVNVQPTTATTAGALRTAQAVIGAVGGVFGLVAILL